MMKLVNRLLVSLTIFLLFCLVGGCRLNAVGNCNCASQTNPSTSPKITSETAVVLAKGYLCFDYDLRNSKIEVDREDINWKVTFRKASADGVEDGPVIFINVDSGVRSRVIHSK